MGIQNYCPSKNLSTSAEYCFNQKGFDISCQQDNDMNEMKK